MSSLVGIGEFSRLTHLSVKALRHYHAVGVLSPSEVDAENGYRRYDTSQLADAHVVHRLRDLEMPLDEIRAVLSAPDDAARDTAISAHLERMERELAHTRAVVSSLRDLLQSPVRPFDVEHRSMPASSALAIREVVAAEDIEAWSGTTFERLEHTVLSAGVAPNDAPGSLFGEEFFENGVGDVMAFVPVDGHGGKQIRIDGGDYVAAVHRGSYHDLDRTYGALGGYVNECGISGSGPIRERYLVGPQDAAIPDDLRTELLWPVAV